MNIQYIPLDLDILDDAKMIRVIRKYGMQGFGIYIRIIILLWKEEDNDFKWGLDEEDIEDLHEALRDRGVDRDVMEDIILHHGLFEKDITEGLPGYFYSKSILRRREKMQSKKEMLSNAGKKGMKSRWENKDIITDNIKGDITTLKGSNKQVITNKEKKTKVNKIKETIQTQYVFEQFWDKYDLKLLRPDCEAIWNGDRKNKRGIKFDDKIRKSVMDHLSVYVKHTSKNGSYPSRKHPRTYLNNNSWEDEVVIAETKKEDYL